MIETIEAIEAKLSEVDGATVDALRKRTLRIKGLLAFRLVRWAPHQKLAGGDR